jgi:transposase
MRNRRSFTPEFKQESACLVLDHGYKMSEASHVVVKVTFTKI